MNLSWLYQLPGLLFFILVIFFVAGISVSGLSSGNLLNAGWVNRRHKNAVISYYIHATGVVYGITLGLITVGIWDKYNHVNVKVEEEAATLAELYRDVSSYPEPYHTELTQELKTYTRFVIDEAWPLQERGIIPTNSIALMNTFQKKLYGFEPATDGQKIFP